MEIENDMIVPFSKLRKKIAERLSFSKSHIPHFYLEIDVNMDAALKLRFSRDSGGNPRLSVNDLIVKATASSLRKFERINSHVEEDKLTLKKNVNIGVAVSIDDGVLVPVIPDADLKNIDEISEISRKKIADARRGVIDFRTIGTFTVSNLGMYGIKNFLPIINPPECGILAVGRIEKRLMCNEEKDGVEPHNMMSMTLACDHRGTDGVYAAKFLDCLRRMLERPEQLFGECES